MMKSGLLSRIVSALLIAAMIVTELPAMVYAAEPDDNRIVKEETDADTITDEGTSKDDDNSGDDSEDEDADGIGDTGLSGDGSEDANHSDEKTESSEENADEEHVHVFVDGYCECGVAETVLDDEESEAEHTLVYTDNLDGTHSAVCTDIKDDGEACEYVIENEEHLFADGICICGAEEETEELTDEEISENGTVSEEWFVYTDDTKKKIKELTALGKEQENIEIPLGVTTIGRQAFEHNTKLKTITLPDTLTTIETEAFTGCSGLSSVTIPKNVHYVDANVFVNCIGLRTITIETTKLTDAKKMFNGCKHIEAVNFPADITVIPDYLFYNTGFDGADITIPAGVTKIGVGAFTGPENAGDFGTTATITFAPNSKLVEIGGDAFRNARWLNSINLPGSLQKIGNYAFEGANALTSIELPASLTYVGMYAFNGCSSLTEVTLNSNPTTYTGYVFDNCKIDTLNFGRSVTKINSNIFRSADFNNCDIVIPKQVTEIADQAFMYAKGISSISFEEGSTLKTIGDSAFIADKKDDNSFTELIFPYGLTTIRGGAFKKNNNITKIVLPSTITFIGNEAFGMGENLPPELAATFYVEEGTYADTWVKDFLKTTAGSNCNIRKTCTISYVLNGGTVAGTNPTSFVKGEDTELTISAPTKAGYAFTGWYKDKACTKKVLDEDETTLSLETIDTKITLYAGFVKLWTVSATAGRGQFSTDGGESYTGTLNSQVRQGAAFTFIYKPDDFGRMKSIQYKVGTKIVKLTPEAVNIGGKDVLKYTINNVASNIVLSISSESMFCGFEYVEGAYWREVKPEVTGNTAVYSGREAGWIINDATAKLTFALTTKPEIIPSVSLAAAKPGVENPDETSSSIYVPQQSESDQILRYGTLRVNKDGTYTYGYSVDRSDIIGKFIMIDYDEVPLRTVVVTYNSDQMSISARVGSRKITPVSSTAMINDGSVVTCPATCTYKFAVGGTFVVTPVAKENCKLTGANYDCQTGTGKFKTAAEYSIKPIQDMTVNLTSADAYQAKFCDITRGGSGEINGFNYYGVSKNTVTVDAEKEYIALIRKGSGIADPTSASTDNYDTVGRIVLMNGKKQVAASQAGKAELVISGLKAYAGKTLTLYYYANGSKKATNTYKLVVKGAAAQIKSLAVTGANSKNVITQAVGTTKSYTVKINPTSVNTSRIYAKLYAADGTAEIMSDSADPITMTDNLVSSKKVTVNIKSTAGAGDVAYLKFYYRMGDSADTSVDPQIKSTFTIRPELTTYTKAAPGIKLNNSTDTELLMTLSLPKGISGGTEHLYYAVSATPVIARGKSLAPGMKAKYPEDVMTGVEYVPVTGNSQTFTMVVGDTEAETHGVQKYNVSVYLVLSRASSVSADPEKPAEVAAEDGTVTTPGNTLAKTKTAVLKNASNKGKANATKLTIAKGTTKLYAGAVTENLIGATGVRVATVKYDSKATVQDLEKVEIIGPDGMVTDKFVVAGADNCGIDVSGATDIYVKVNPSVYEGETEPYDINYAVNDADNGIKPGNYTVKVYARRASAEAKQVVASSKFTVLNPITSVTVKTPSEVVLKKVGKAITIKPSVSYKSYAGGSSPAVKKVTWSLLFPNEETSGVDHEIDKYVSINKKTGVVTINKNYTLPADTQCVFGIVAIASDYAGNSYTGDFKVINIVSERYKPVSVSMPYKQDVVYVEGADPVPVNCMLQAGELLMYNTDGFKDAKLSIKAMNGDTPIILDNGNFSFKSSNAAIRVTSDGTSENSGIVSFVPGKKITKKTNVTITATATDGSGYSIKFNFYLIPYKATH